MSELQTLTTPSGAKLYHIGPALDAGPLPTLFYLALSGEESLSLEPINTPAAALARNGIRVVSLTLPEHEMGKKHTEGMLRWSHRLQQDEHFFQSFLKECQECLDHLIDKRITDPLKVAAAGISRGGFAAAHFAASEERIKHLLCFAPLLRLTDLEEFQPLAELPSVRKLDLFEKAGDLVSKNIRIYIGNRDLRVETKSSMEWVLKAAEAQFQANFRSPQVELIVFPSIGHKGHGTPSEIFQNGADWLKSQLSL